MVNAAGTKPGGIRLPRAKTLAVKDLIYIDDLAHKNSEALSFIPMPRLEQYWQNGQILTSYENGELCGYLVYGLGWPVMRIYQACIQYDARRKQHGFELVSRLITIASSRSVSWISLWCANDLESNSFWREAGFEFCGVREGGRRRKRKHNLWKMAIHLLPIDGNQAPSGLNRTSHRLLTERWIGCPAALNLTGCNVMGSVGRPQLAGRMRRGRTRF